MPSYFLGLISGTSMDAVDAAIADFDSSPIAPVAAKATPLPDTLRQRLLALAQHSATSWHELPELDVQLGELFAEAALDVVRDTGFSPRDVCAIGSHGQTVFHHAHARHRP
jgi:anhydro-N-acetylmuramic acid kinase